MTLTLTFQGHSGSNPIMQLDSPYMIEWFPPWVTQKASTKNEVNLFNIFLDILLTDSHTDTQTQSKKHRHAKHGRGLITVWQCNYNCLTVISKTSKIAYTFELRWAGHNISQVKEHNGFVAIFSIPF